MQFKFKITRYPLISAGILSTVKNFVYLHQSSVYLDFICLFTLLISALKEILTNVKVLKEH